MSFRTILVYFNLAERSPNLLGYVLPFARAQDAHLVGLAVIPRLHMYAALTGEYASGLIDEQRSAFRRQAEAIGAEFQSRTAAEGISSEWRCEDAGPLGVAASVVELATGADLVVAEHAGTETAWEVLAAVPERLLLEGKRPLVLTPQAGDGSVAAQRVTIGWKRRPEAARAAFDALPVLRNADHVEIVAVHDGDGPNEAQEAFSPADDVAAALARHGVEVEIAVLSSEGRSEGEALLARAHAQGSDLLVIGAYGRSRVSEFVFGGVTRHVLGHMTLPVFMAH